MDINFPLILVIVVFLSGLVILLDKLVLAKRRDEATAEPVVVEYSKSFFPVLFIVLILRSFIAEPFQIPSGSMIPTLEVGDFILVNKFTYGIRLPVVRTKVLEINKPERGDVMVFFPPHDKRYFIKRVIGLPGDKITYSNGSLYLNNKLVENELLKNEKVDKSFHDNHFCYSAEEHYQIFDETIGDTTHLMRKCTTPIAFPGERTWVVPEAHYFMMGDNRDHSSDSRKWGMVPEKNIVGKAFAIWMHWKGFSSLPSFSRAGSIK